MRAGLVKLLVCGKMLSVKPAPTRLDEGYSAFPACEVHLNVGGNVGAQSLRP